MDLALLSAFSDHLQGCVLCSMNIPYTPYKLQGHTPRTKRRGLVTMHNYIISYKLWGSPAINPTSKSFPTIRGEDVYMDHGHQTPSILNEGCG